MKRTLLYLVCLTFIGCEKTTKIQNVSEEGYALYNEALTYLDRGVADSAFLVFENAKNIFLEHKDSLNVANCLINMAITQKDQGDYFGAQETALEAIDYLNTDNPEHYVYLSTNYNNLGVATNALGDKDRAIDFYNLAIKFAADSALVRTYRSNLGRLYQEKKDYSRAISIYSAILQEENKGTTDFARILTNYATAMWQYQKSYNPVKDLTHALSIRKQKNDLWGQNSSYAYLSDYYEKIKPDSSLYFARKQYAIAKVINSASDQASALKRLIRLSSIDSARAYFAVYHQLTDSIQQARAAAKNQFALIRYEVEKNKADNLRLEKENAEKQSRLVRQRAITGASIFLLLIATGGGSLWYKRRKQRLELEAQHKIKETQLNISKKVHDVVANDIYRVMTEVEYKDDLDREGLLDKLEVIYNQSRDISHNVDQLPVIEVPYNEQISALLRSFATDHRRVSIAGNDAEQWADISKRVKNEVKYVLQELMVNMKKHSQAEQVVVRFEKSDRQLKIFYKDNGIGIPKVKSEGKGLTNTVSRIENLGGEIIFASEPGKGLSITANIPLI